MSMPDTSALSDSILTQIYATVSGMAIDVAVIKSQMTRVDDQEQRLRELRAEVPPELTKRLGAVEAAVQVAAGQVAGSRDTQARVTSWAAGALAAAGAVVNYFHH